MSYDDLYLYLCLLTLPRQTIQMDGKQKYCCERALKRRKQRNYVNIYIASA